MIVDRPFFWVRNIIGDNGKKGENLTMTIRFIGAVCTVVCSLMLFAGPLQAETVDQPEENSCESLLVGKCSDCHYLTRVCQKLGKKSKGDWRRSIKRMVRKGLVLSKAERKLLVECLHKEKEGARKACKPYE